MFADTTSASTLRSRIAAHLVNFMLSRDDVALDIIELLALRMRSREDYQVATVGFFVRANLLYLEKGVLSFCDVLERLTIVAMNAPHGHESLVHSMDASIGH